MLVLWKMKFWQILEIFELDVGPDFVSFVKTEPGIGRSPHDLLMLQIQNCTVSDKNYPACTVAAYILCVESTITPLFSQVKIFLHLLPAFSLHNRYFWIVILEINIRIFVYIYLNFLMCILYVNTTWTHSARFQLLISNSSISTIVDWVKYHINYTLP